MRAVPIYLTRSRGSQEGNLVNLSPFTLLLLGPLPPRLGSQNRSAAPAGAAAMVIAVPPLRRRVLVLVGLLRAVTKPPMLFPC
jgi:hypothetical protein